MTYEDKIKKEILQNKIVRDIINNLNLNIKQIESGFDVFLKIIDESKNSKNLDYVTKVEIYDDETIVGVSVPSKNFMNTYKREKNCWLSDISKLNPDLKLVNPREKQIGNVKSNLFYWELPGFEKTNKRNLIADWLTKFFREINQGKFSKGIYLHGSFGLGKTFFLSSFANSLIEKNKTVAFVNVNDLYEYMTRNMEKNNDLNSYTIQKMKHVDVLIIDDIGSEKPNSWFLFSILYPILDYRLKENKTTSFSSIFSINNLKKYWLKSKELDSVKIERIVNKIKSLTNQVEIFGEDLRQ